jgi:hypothetical protein
MFFQSITCLSNENHQLGSFPGQREIFMGKQFTVAIITGYFTDSNLLLVLGTKYHKSVTVLFYGQEWEQYCCFTNIIFDQKQMVAQLYQSAISFSTLPGSISAHLPSNPLISAHYLVAMLRHMTPLSNEHKELYISQIEVFHFYVIYSYALISSLLVPIFNARESNLNSLVDFKNLSNTFSNFDGEIPVGSCVATGHSMTSYSEKKGGKDDTDLNLGTNILFVIIFGTPEY